MITRLPTPRRWRWWTPVVAAVVGVLLMPSHVAAQALPEGPGPPRNPLGDATLVDGQASLDRLEVHATGVTMPAGGESLRVWLLGDDGTTARYLGDVVPDADGAVSFVWDQPAAENLLAQYSQAVITRETDPAGNVPGGVVVRTGRLDASSLPQVRRLLSRWPDSRYGIATVPGLRRQAVIARDQAWILREAVITGDWDTARRKGEQLVNLVEGRHGLFYADHNRDGRIEDPGDGTGFLPYTWGALTQTQFTYATAQDEMVAEDAKAIQPPVTFAMMSAGFVRDAAWEVAHGAGPARSRELAGHLVTATNFMLAAIDPKGDPSLEAVLEERSLTSTVELSRALVRIGLEEVSR